MKRITCSKCGREISTEVPDSFELSGSATCPNCKRQEAVAVTVTKMVVPDNVQTLDKKRRR